jgi:biotin carboxylase
MAVGAGEKGPITVNRYHHDARLREIVVKLVRGFGMTGISSPEFIIEDGTGDAYLLEINRRIVGGAHRGSDFNVDHAVALHAALHGYPMQTRASLEPEEEHISVHFPQEWLRDPESPWLRNYPVDVPWDDPDLLEALVAMRHAS